MNNVSCQPTLLSSYFDTWNKSFVYKGKSSRYEFCVFMLSNIILSIAILAMNNYSNHIVILISFILLSLIPTTTLLIRRLHDVNRQGKLVILFIGGLCALAAGAYQIVAALSLAGLHQRISFNLYLDWSSNGFFLIFIGLMLIIHPIHLCLLNHHVERKPLRKLETFFYLN